MSVCRQLVFVCCFMIKKLLRYLGSYGIVPAFSVMCKADICRHPSFDMLSKQDGLKSTNHRPLT